MKKLKVIETCDVAWLLETIEHKLVDVHSMLTLPEQEKALEDAIEFVQNARFDLDEESD